MSDSADTDEPSEHAKSLVVLSKFCLAAASLIDVEKMPGLHTAMLAVLAEVDTELGLAGLPMHRVVKP